MNKQDNSLIKFALVLLSITLAVGGGFYFFQRYQDANETIESLKRDNVTLENRIQILSSSSEELAKYVDTAYRSIPESNVGLFAMNTLRDTSSEEEVLVDGVFVKSASSSENNKLTAELGFQVEGETEKVFNFLYKLSQSLPVLKLKEQDTRVTEDDFATSNVSMEAYSQALPQSLPSLKENLSPLSEDERELLSRLNTFRNPSLEIQQLSDSPSGEGGPLGRPNPFSAISTQTTEVVETVEEE